MVREAVVRPPMERAPNCSCSGGRAHARPPARRQANGGAIQSAQGCRTSPRACDAAPPHLCELNALAAVLVDLRMHGDGVAVWCGVRRTACTEACAIMQRVPQPQPACRRSGHRHALSMGWAPCRATPTSMKGACSCQTTMHASMHAAVHAAVAVACMRACMQTTTPPRPPPRSPG